LRENLWKERASGGKETIAQERRVGLGLEEYGLTESNTCDELAYYKS